MQGLHETAFLRFRQVYLCHVARDNHLRIPSHTCQEHADLGGCGILRLVQNDYGVTQRAPTHKGQRSYLDDVLLHHILQLHLWQHILQSVVERLQIGVYLFLHVARQETELLASLHSRAREDNLLRRLILQCFHGQGYRQVGLTCTGRSHGKHHVVLLVGIDELLLVLAASLDGAARHGVAHHVVGDIVGSATTFHNV